MSTAKRANHAMHSLESSTPRGHSSCPNSVLETEPELETRCTLQRVLLREFQSLRPKEKDKYHGLVEVVVLDASKDSVLSANVSSGCMFALHLKPPGR